MIARNLPIGEHLQGAAPRHAGRRLAQDRAHEVVAVHAPVAVFEQPRGAAHRVRRDHERRVRDDQVEGFALDGFEEGALAHVDGGLVEGRVELGERARPRRQVGRDDAVRVSREVQGLDAAAAANVQRRFDALAHRHLQQRQRRPADSEHVVVAQRLAGLHLRQVRGHPPLVVPIRRRGGVRAQVEEGAHPRVGRLDAAGGLAAGVGHGRNGGGGPGRGLLRSHALGAQPGESQGGVGLVDGGGQAEGLQAQRAEGRQGMVEDGGARGHTEDEEAREGRRGVFLLGEFDEGGQAGVAHERVQRGRTEHGLQVLNAPAGGDRVGAKLADQVAVEGGDGYGGRHDSSVSPRVQCAGTQRGAPREAHRRKAHVRRTCRPA